MQYSNEQIKEFLEESNAIEGVHGSEALIDAISAWYFLESFGKLTIKTILEVHKRLLRHLNPSIAGKFRTCDVQIGGKTKPFISIPYFKDELATFCKDSNRYFSPGLLFAPTKQQGKNITKKLHIRFEHLHPFEDGNGRTGRIIMNWHNLKRGLPINIIHTGDEQLEYYKWF